jgi:hypothetical protein
MHPWAKISSKIAESEQFADAANADLLAGVLFAMMLPQADLYGVIPGNLRVFIGKVCPLLDQPEAAIDAALTVLHDRGLIVRYEADGKQWVWLPKWNLHQDVRWTRTGPPDYPLPDGWTPPDELVQACQGDAECARPLTRWFRRTFRDNPADSGSIRETPGVSGTLPPRLDTESDAESENDSSPRPADAPSLELILEPDPPKPPARSKLDPAQVQADIDAARATFPQDLLSGIDAFLDACRAENKTGAIALTRERTETMALADAYAKLGDGPFRYGLDAALRKGAANVNYLKAAAGSYSADAPRRPQANAYDDPQEAARREYAEQHDRLFGGVR